MQNNDQRKTTQYTGYVSMKINFTLHVHVNIINVVWCLFTGFLSTILHFNVRTQRAKQINITTAAPSINNSYLLSPNQQGGWTKTSW